MNNEEKLHRDLEEMLELDTASLKGDEALENLNWDSMAVVMFIAMADKNYGVAVNVGDVRNAKNVADLYALISK